ncbi:Lipoprotein-anchoring transpeptidase ErfK/SrfK [Prosthecobacter debontii]|uniref:Lipoprotein-anchoring transpeptidase ErfK/SrfK n=2 Tax=Prosthecobacter debontii TaxID=48467 RepID=A0A1T4Y4G1_9BACT|nr:Lipoprotein-anchoring transpeptidase ErfK/SrfK [Prosthecobacter debontii]
MNAIRFSFALLTGCILSSCQLPLSMIRQEVIRKPLVVQPADSSNSPLYVWHGSGEPGPVRVTIDLSEQKAYIFQNSENIGWSYVATGRSGFRTPTGTFVITEKVVNKRSNKYGSIVDANGNTVRSNATAGVHGVPSGGKFLGAKMPYWMRLTNYGVGMHAGPIPHPGSPASHGCIRLPYDMAERIFEVAPSGTRVTIVP